eukprot:9462285-Karenia_brevis.AAC.1
MMFLSIFYNSEAYSCTVRCMAGWKRKGPHCMKCQLLRIEIQRPFKISLKLGGLGGCRWSQ